MEPQNEAVSLGELGFFGEELQLSLGDDEINALLERAVAHVEEVLVNAHIQAQSQGKLTLISAWTEGLTDGYSPETRTLLGLASRKGQNSWFKSVTKFEGVARDIVGPNLVKADSAFAALVGEFFRWTHAT